MNQGTRTWYLCYHSTKLPVTTFVHLDDVNESTRFTNFTAEPPDANSTINDSVFSETPSVGHTTVLSGSLKQSTPRTPSGCPTETFAPYDVGHMSHIPRIPPSQTTFTIPNETNKSMRTMYDHEEDIFGMIKLRDNDVCYTSGTIEWVGRKRSYPLNSGFKLLDEQYGSQHQNQFKKFKKSFYTEGGKFKECDCADVLPTVNAIVDHLNALHEAVDIVGLRLNTLEEAISKNNN